TTDGGVDPTGPAAYVGRFDVHRKGIDRLAAWLQVAADSTAERPLLRLFAPAGDAPPPALAELIARGVVAWDTETSGADLAGPLRQCRALMLLSRYEGQPRVLREAALLGLPVITTTAGNFTEAITALGGGVVVDGDDPAAVQDAFAQVA